MKIIGIDLGLCNMGWGIVVIDGLCLWYVVNGIIYLVGDEFGLCFVMLYCGLCVVIVEYCFEVVVVEQIFVNKDVVGMLKLGQVCGIVLLLVVEVGLFIGEYVLNVVKKIVVGVGYVVKEQVQYMVCFLLLGVEFCGVDVVDVLVIVICYVYYL